MKEFRKRIKELRKMLNDKKKRSMIVISMYVVFVLLIIIAISLKTTPSYELSKPIEDFKSINNYNYSYSITSKVKDEITNYVIYGKRFNDKRQLIYNDTIYNFESGRLVGFPLEEFDISRLEYNDIYELLYMSNKIGKKNLIQDGLYKEDYELTLNRFVRYMNSFNVPSNKLIKITVIHQNNELMHIDFDLKEYVNLNEKFYDRYTVSVSYTNIGNVVDF